MEHTSKQILLNKISKAFDLLRGSLLDTFDSFKIIYVLLAYKRFNDLFEEGKVSKNSLIKIPEGCRWSQIETSSKQIFKQIDINLKKISSTLFHQQSILGRRGINEYVTPISLSKLMVKLLDPQITDKIYDPIAGMGDTLITAVSHIYDNNGWPDEQVKYKMPNDIDFYEKNVVALALVKLRLAIAGILSNSTIKRGPIFELDDFGLEGMNKADVVFLPAFSSQLIKLKGSELHSILIPYDYCLSDNGRMSVVLPQSFLFRKDVRDYRGTLFEEIDCIEAIIQLPAGLWPQTTIETTLLILSMNKPKDRKHKALFTIAECVQKDKITSISDKEIERIVATFKDFKVRTENEEVVTF